MKHPDLVRREQGRRELPPDGDDFTEREWRGPLPREEARAIDELHGEKHRGVGHTEVMHPRNVRMRHLAGHRDFAPLLVGHQNSTPGIRWRDRDLESNGLPEQFVHRAVDRTHPASAQRAYDRVALREALPECESLPHRA